MKIVRRVRIACASVAATALLIGAGVTSGAENASAATTVISVTQTTSDLSQALTSLPSITLGPVSSGSINLSINDATKFQKVDGFGAAFTDTSTYVLKNQLSSAAYAQVMNDLFTRSGNGIALSFMRVPIGSSDFTATPIANPGPYSYADNAGVADPTLSSFSIAHDEAYTIPLILQAQALNPQMKLFASQWSPPAWMKTDNTMLGSTNGTLLPSMYGPMAIYQTKFLQAYAAAGIDVWGITPQNEPEHFANGYPGMLLSAENAASYIKNNLAPALADAGLSTKIIGGDTGGVDVAYATTLFNDANVKSKIYATGWHCYKGSLDDLPSVAALAPDKPTYVTECSTGAPWVGLNAAQLALISIYNGASGVQLWNLATDTAGGPKIGLGCGGCNGLVTVDPLTQSASYTSNFYQLGQFSKFVHPDATHVGSTDGGGVWARAFQNADGSEALVAYNNNGTPTTFTTTWNNQGSFTYTLPGYATVTFSTSPTTGIVDGATFEIGALSSGKLLSVDNSLTTDGANVQQWTDFSVPAQRWVVSSVGSGYYEIRNVNSNKLLSLSGTNSTLDGANVHQWTDLGTYDHQLWQIVSTGAGTYKIVNKFSGKVLQVAGGSSALGDGANVNQSTYTGTTNQQWRFGS
jgi:glucosylceramidase